MTLALNEKFKTIQIQQFEICKFTVNSIAKTNRQEKSVKRPLTRSILNSTLFKQKNYWNGNEINLFNDWRNDENIMELYENYYSNTVIFENSYCTYMEIMYNYSRAINSFIKSNFGKFYIQSMQFLWQFSQKPFYAF